MLAALVPGIQLNTNAQNVGGINGPAPPFFGGHGGAGTEGRLNMDGIGTGGATGGVSLLIVDTGNAAEITVSTTGGSADAEIGGPIINVVPRTGGNAFSGQFFFAGAGPGHAERQLHAGIEGRRPAVALGAEEGLGRQPRSGWTHQAGQAVVLRDDAESGELRLHFEYLFQQERRRSQCLDLRCRTSTISRRPTRGGRARRCATPGRCRPATRSRCSGTSSPRASSARAAAARRRRRRPPRRTISAGCGPIRRCGTRRSPTASCSKRASRAWASATAGKSRGTTAT